MSLLKTGHERIEHDSGCANAYHPMFVLAHVLFFTHGKLCSSAEVVPLFSEREPKITEKSLLVNRQFLFHVSNPLHKGHTCLQDLPPLSRSWSGEDPLHTERLAARRLQSR